MSASPETIFQIYAEVENWPAWDPDTESAGLGGPFEVGSRGRLTPTKGNTVPMLLTVVEPGRRFTIESRIPLFHMILEHELLRRGSETDVIHRVTFKEPLKFIIGRMRVKQLDSGLPLAFRRLKALAETQSAA